VHSRGNRQQIGRTGAKINAGPARQNACTEISRQAKLIDKPALVMVPDPVVAMLPVVEMARFVAS